MDRAVRCLSSFEAMARRAVEGAVTWPEPELRAELWPEFRSIAQPQARTGAAPGCLLVDATAGNGYDTLFLAGLARQAGGAVLAFDVQPQALEATRQRLCAAGLDPRENRVRLVCASHADMDAHVGEGSGSPVVAVMFNLGFLPGSDKRVTTRSEETLTALRKASALLAVHGVLTVHAYTGHPGGADEAQAVGGFARTLSRKQWRVQAVTEANRSENVEYLWLMERIAE